MTSAFPDDIDDLDLDELDEEEEVKPKTHTKQKSSQVILTKEALFQLGRVESKDNVISASDVKDASTLFEGMDDLYQAFGDSDDDEEEGASTTTSVEDAGVFTPATVADTAVTGSGGGGGAANGGRDDGAADDGGDVSQKKLRGKLSPRYMPHPHDDGVDADDLAQIEMDRELTDLIDQMWEHCPSNAVREKMLKLFKTIIGNILAAPTSTKYRRLKTDKIMPRLDMARFSLELLYGLGFFPQADFIVLPGDANLHVLYRAMQLLIELQESNKTLAADELERTIRESRRRVLEQRARKRAQKQKLKRQQQEQDEQDKQHTD